MSNPGSSSSSPSGVNLKSLQDNFRKQLEKDNVITKAIKTVSDKTKVAKEHVAYGAIGFLVFYLMFGWGNDFVCNLIGFLYPAYASVKAIESLPKDDDTKWLMYWSCYGLFDILEYFSDQLLYWIPFYILVKALILVWLMVPGKSGGTYIIYNRFLKPFCLKHGSVVERTADKVSETMKRD